MNVTALTILWTAWVSQAVLAAMQVRKFARQFDRPEREAFEQYRPPAAVIVPFKGLEPGLADNLRGLCAQDYPDYRLVFVVESEDDPAYPVLQEARQAQIARCPQRPIDLLVAGEAGPDTGQKVHNQLTAIAHLESQNGGEQVWVFADSDAVPGPTWLGELVGPLGQDKTAVSTGYRWLVPVAGEEHDQSREQSAALWTKLASIMNSSVASFLGRDRLNHAWGGSMALRVETAREGELQAMLRGSLSDDYQVSRMAKKLGRRIYFVPSCLIASPAHFTFTSLLNFAHRQHLITRIHAPGLYFGGAALLTLFVAGVLSAWVALIVELAQRPGQGRWLVPAAAIAAVFLANQWRATWRRRAVERALGEAVAQQLRPTLRLERWMTPLWMTLHWLLMLRAGVGRTIRWRGITYRLDSPNQIRRLDASHGPPRETAAAKSSS